MTTTTDDNRDGAGACASASRSNSILSRLRAFGREECGAAVVLAAILFPVVIGGMGLGAETGYWYMIQRKLQHAADTSVHAAAVRKMQGDEAGMKDAAETVARRTGLSEDRGVLALDPDYGGYEDSVEVVLTEERDRLFSAVVAGMFSAEPQTTVTLSARAVAAIEVESNPRVACVLALSKSQPGAVTISGSTEVNLEGCEVASNSAAPDAFRLGGTSAKLTADCVNTVGGANPSTSVNMTLSACGNEVKQYAQAVADPYESVPEPSYDEIACESKNKIGSPGGTLPLNPSQTHSLGMKAMRFCGGLDVKGTVEFAPGLYIIDGGPFTANSGQADSTAAAKVVGKGVTLLFVRGAKAELTGNVSVELSAPETGPLSGVLLFGGRQNTAEHKITGNSGVSLQGALYASAGRVVYKGNSAGTGSGGCTQIIANSVEFTGSSMMQSQCEQVGGSNIVTNKFVRIVE